MQSDQVSLLKFQDYKFPMKFVKNATLQKTMSHVKMDYLNIAEH